MWSRWLKLLIDHSRSATRRFAEPYCRATRQLIVHRKNTAVAAVEVLEDRTLLTCNSVSQLWESVDQIVPADSTPTSESELFEVFALDTDELQSVLAAAPFEFTQSPPAEIALPNPNGEFTSFHVVESPIMAPELAAKFPEIKTFSGQGIDNPSETIRFDFTPAGFHAQILSPLGNYYIDPIQQLGETIYISHFGQGLTQSDDFHVDEQVIKLDDGSSGEQLVQEFSGNVASLTTGTELRTYQLAVAATGEYTAFHGGTVAAGQAAIVTAINRVNGIYETELAVRLQLVANNDSLIFTNASSDPYSNNNGGAMLGQNQTTIDNVIGNANYDIGHVFSTGGGGVAFLGVVGVSGSKAGGVTGLSSPTGDTFYVDFVAHEIGHQFGGNHTFNGDSSSCSGGNRNASTAYEPGSGSTIMAYAGICGNDNLQSNSDPYFHSASFDEIVNYTTTGVGNSAATITSTGNNAPTVNAGGDFTIPANTAFTLTATGSDADGDALTYGWEQRDLGSQQDVNAGDNGSSPLFRSFSATTDPSRTFPRLSDLLNNTTAVGETLPTTNRTMDFRVTARDNRSSGGGVNSDDMTVTIVNTGSPFQVTSQNTATTWTGGTTQTITWDVAGTTGSSINAANVNILLSTDGGSTFSTTLASNTANDGSESIVVPNLSTSSARIKVEAVGNIFFDVSNTNFTINASSGGGSVSTVRVRLTDTDYLHMAEVQILEVGTGTNVALTGTASQSSTLFGASASLANDGNTNQSSVSHTDIEFGASWQVALSAATDVETITIYNRGNCCGDRLEGAVVETLDAAGNVLFTATITGAVDNSIHTFTVSTAPDTTAPTADLSDPSNGGSINDGVLNGRDYIEVTFADSGGSGLNASTIGGDEITISGAGVGTASLSGSATLVSSSTYRYGFNGAFVAGSVNVNFVANTWQDNSGNANAAETESFTVTVSSGSVSTVRVRLTDTDYLHMAEVQILEVGTGTNVALTGTASQSSTLFGASASLANDGNTNQSSVSHTDIEFGASWQVALSAATDIETITIYNRGNCCGDRLEGAVVETLDAAGNVLFTATITGAVDNSIHTFTVSAAASQYKIDVLFIDSSLTASQQAIFTSAANRWSEIITGDVPDVFVPGSFFTDGVGRTVDDIAIEASAPAIDGVGGILGQAGPTGIRSGSSLPAVGSMAFDSADVASLESSGGLIDVILHEMAHVIGFGTIWDDLSLITGAGGSDPRFTGSAATSEYNSIFGVSESSVPVANTGGSGTRDSHWRESVFTNELMTGFLNSGTNPISRVTAASLGDLGYVVNVAAADSFSPRAAINRSNQPSNAPQLSRSASHANGSGGVVSFSGGFWSIAIADTPIAVDATLSANESGRGFNRVHHQIGPMRFDPEWQIEFTRGVLLDEAHSWSRMSQSAHVDGARVQSPDGPEFHAIDGVMSDIDSLWDDKLIRSALGPNQLVAGNIDSRA